MSACGDCGRRTDREARCPVCFGGGPAKGLFVEWYERLALPGGGVRMEPRTGKVASVDGASLVVRLGKSGTGKVVTVAMTELTRVVR